LVLKIVRAVQLETLGKLRGKLATSKAQKMASWSLTWLDKRKSDMDIFEIAFGCAIFWSVVEIVLFIFEVE